ncbi:hypothetical protein F2P81_022018 [Scophthalmus maximus]|uniref:Uncharacterized protein n=1 Tax=Scophthalmus maximus TaxID=52904 RepID=A0A6A4RXF2_SCOMX|nr:hypothetical protein F2P81_022018 [Scophthalmus maximus]
MEKRPRCGAAVCDYAPPPEENQSADYTLQLAVGLASQTRRSEMTDNRMAMERIYSFRFRIQAETLRDTEILFTLIAAAALMETLITVLLSVELVLRPHAGQKWPMFKRLLAYLENINSLKPLSYLPTSPRLVSSSWLALPPVHLPRLSTSSLSDMRNNRLYSQRENSRASGALSKQTGGRAVRRGWRHAITNHRLLAVAGALRTRPRYGEQGAKQGPAVLVFMVTRQQH